MPSEELDVQARVVGDRDQRVAAEAQVEIEHGAARGRPTRQSSAATGDWARSRVLLLLWFAAACGAEASECDVSGTVVDCHDADLTQVTFDASCHSDILSPGEDYEYYRGLPNLGKFY